MTVSSLAILFPNFRRKNLLANNGCLYLLRWIVGVSLFLWILTMELAGLPSTQLVRSHICVLLSFLPVNPQSHLLFVWEDRNLTESRFDLSICQRGLAELTDL